MQVRCKVIQVNIVHQPMTDELSSAESTPTLHRTHCSATDKYIHRYNSEQQWSIACLGIS